MGDSFASGEGDDSVFYAAGTDEPENKCHLSTRSYPFLLANILQLDVEDFHSVACSGAISLQVTSESQQEDETENVELGVWTPGINPQKEYLYNLDISPTSITISIGGNDVGFADKLQECVLGPGTCKYAEDGQFRADVAKEITHLHPTLIDTYNKLKSETGNQTKIYAVGYPLFVRPEGGSCGLNVHLNDTERKFIAEGVGYIDQIVRSAAEEAGIYYLDIENSLEGKRLCDDVTDGDMAVNGLTQGNDVGFWMIKPIGAESYHPNGNGHWLMMDAISNLTNGDLIDFSVCADSPNQAICPRGDGQVPAPSDYWGYDAINYAQEVNASAHPSPPALHRSLIESVWNVGAEIKDLVVEQTNLQANSTADFYLHSTLVHLGAFTADQYGTVRASVALPEGVEPGFHTLRLYGTEPAGDPIEYYQHVYVPGPENDLDNNGIQDITQACLFVADTGVDKDQDGVDDACDGLIASAPKSNTQSSSAQPNSLVLGAAKTIEQTSNEPEQARLANASTQQSTDASDHTAKQDYVTTIPSDTSSTISSNTADVNRFDDMNRLSWKTWGLIGFAASVVVSLVLHRHLTRP
jgi:hypothetical protein